MAVTCPYCQFVMALTGVKAGRYTPACQRCKKKFLIVVPAEGDPTVKTFEEGVAEAQKAAHAGDRARETVPPRRSDTSLELPASGPDEGVHAAHWARERPEKIGGRPGMMPALPESLGGYQLQKKLGEGGMGAVYLARQVSLDRTVAVKVMNRAWAGDPDFIARFTREAYAAAQLTHHNIVQIYDIGVERDVHYFSMEYVPGNTLAERVQAQKRLDPEEAAGYALQAARGLKFAHDHGMIHRDIKPENLLLNEQGLVKVLDLGLVKTPEGKDKALALPARMAGTAKAANPMAALATGTTQMNVSMGTPDYMSPEQAQDAAGVDQRADIYSLGCTLYDFVVGKPPFEGKTVMEVLTKHASEPVTPPELLVKRVPSSLSHIVQRMVAKKKEDRYASMEGVIKDLEGFLGINNTGPFSPTEEHASLLERNVDAFNKSPLASVRRNVWRAGLVGGLILMAVFLFFGPMILAGAIAGLLVLTPMGYQVVIGLTQRTHLFTRLRQLAFGASVIDWLKFAGVALLTVLVLWIFGLLWVWIVVAAVAVGIALGMALLLDVMVRRQRRPYVEQVQVMLRSMRLKGLEEDALRHFVCKYSEKNWEEFFETLFGFEAKMRAREAWGRGESGRERKKYGAWRDSLIAWAEARMRERREKRDRALLERLEEKSLRSKGASREDAKLKAKAAAEWMVGQATSIREEKRRRRADTAAPATTIHFEPTESEMLVAKRERARVAAARSFGGGLGVMVLGPHVRLFLGVLAITVCLLWLHQNDALEVKRVQDWVMNNFQGGYYRVAEPWKVDKTGPADVLDMKFPKKMKPVELPLLSSYLTREQSWKLFNSLSWGIAGVLLMLASFWRGVRISFFIIPAALVMIAGETLGIPAVAGFAAWQVAYMVGGALAVLAFWQGQEVG